MQHHTHLDPISLSHLDPICIFCYLFLLFLLLPFFLRFLFLLENNFFLV
jgi:hypothetical protein